VLTVMKGFYSQGICVYCTRQTSDLAKTTGDIRNLDAEVFVCYPGREEHINAFVRSVRDYEKSDDPRFQLPFKVLLDVDQNAVRALNIAGDLAHPTTFIIDKQGVIQYQYTGRTVSDRPAAKDILEEVKKLSK
jgi:peroxiredoxin